MNRKSVPPENNEENETLENDSRKNPPTFEENEPFNDFDEQFNEWLVEAGGNVRGKEFRVYVKRVKGSNQYVHLETYRNRFPSLDEIGAKWGGGRFHFQYNLLVPRERSKNGKLASGTTVEIDESWNEIAKQIKDDERRRRAIQAGDPGSGDLAGLVNSKDAVGQALGLSQAIINMVKQVMETTAERTPAAAPMDSFKALNAMAEEMVRGNIKALYGLRNQAFREIPFGRSPAPAALREPELTPVEPEENPLLNIVSGVIDEYAPKILGGGVIAEQAVEFIKSMMPKFSNITSDPDSMQLIVNTCCQKHGIDKTKELFARIGIPLQ